ncbi:MAG: glycoside hydrolase family 55 protein [Verrucomicrobiae bacterium]|nr:glycoside hydrolase family 55 protein [Verrucomicrobiae bacterium]
MAYHPFLRAAALSAAAMLIVQFPAAAATGGARMPPPRLVFPEDASVLNVKRDFNARGDGRTDDTEALQRALDASSQRGGGQATKLLYLPNGTYRLTSNLVVHAAVGPWVYGESRDGVILRLDDGVPTNITSVLRTHPSDTKPTSADFFMRNFCNFTLDVGRNPHVDGVRWYGNNSSLLKYIRIIGTGSVGVNAGFLGQNGPSLVQDVVVEGSFETGVRCAWSWGQTLSRLTVRNARKVGVHVNATAVGIEDLVVENTPVALHNEYPNNWTWWGGVVALTGGRFTGSDPTQPAITNTSVLYARNVSATGFKQVLVSTTPGGSRLGAELEEYTSHPAKKLFPDSPDTALKLPIQPEPQVPWETNLSRWVCVNDFGAVPGDNKDDTPAFQAAMDAAAKDGKTTVYFRGIGGRDPNWYTLNGEVRLPASVRHVIGLGFGRIIGGNAGRFLVDDASAPVVKFQHIHAFGGRPAAVENRSTSRVLVVESCDLRIVGGGRGDIFVTDCPSHIELKSPGQHLWARQLNPEGDSDTGLVRNHGGLLWALGIKHEGRGVRFLTDQGGATEILGLFNYAPDVATNDFRPMFDIKDAAFSAMGVREISFGKTYPVKVRETRGAETRTEQGGGWIGWALYSGRTLPARQP